MSYFLKPQKNWKAYLLAFIIISFYPLINVYNSKKFYQETSHGLDILNSSEVLSEESEVTKSISATPMISSIPRQQARVKIGISVNDYSNKRGELSGLESKIGYKFTSVSIFKQFGHPTNKFLNVEDLQYIKNNGKVLLLAWEPWNPLETNQSVDYLSQVPKGQHDSYIKEFVQQIKDYGAPVVLRFGHEMNGNWYPWGLRPDEYKSAYRYIVDFFRREGVKNVKFMWSINSESVPYEPIENVSKYYPGSDVVDLIGIDGFNWGEKNWRSFKEIFSPAYSYLSRTYNTSIIISETASSEDGGDKADWIQDMFVTLDFHMPKVKEIIWFSILKEKDWRIDSSQSALNSFKNILQLPHSLDKRN